MKKYRLFFSWQNDRKATKSIINKALNNAADKFKKEGIELIIDQDTSGRTGKRKIDEEVLEKIRKCDIFVADLTPVITYRPPQGTNNLPKHMPNSNVMFEYGYAQHAKGENRMIVLASLNIEDDEHIEYMPFDINHDTITLFNEKGDLDKLYDWIKKIIEDVDAERAAFKPAHAASMFFLTENEPYSNEITVRPKYQRTCYTAGHKYFNQTEDIEATPAVTCAKIATGSYSPILNILQNSRAKIETVIPINKTTNHSYVPISLVFVNRGNMALDNLKIRVNASDDKIMFYDTNVNHTIFHLMAKSKFDTMVSEKIVSQEVTTLNPDEIKTFNTFYIRAPHDIGSFYLEWKLNSRDFSEEGKLLVRVEPEYVCESVKNDKLAYTEEVTDYIEYE